MFKHHNFFKAFVILITTVVGLIACTPSFETTEEICATYDPVTLATTETIDNTEFEVLARRTTNNYKLYLEDAFNSLNGIVSKDSNNNTSALTADERAAIQFIVDKANEKMGYTLDDNGNVKSANNPIDYIESLFAATNADEVIQTFVDAKQNLAQAISQASRACNYSNSAINLVIEDSDKNIVKALNTQISLNYNPHNKDTNKDDIDQIILISLYDDLIDDLTINERQAKSFSGFTRIASEEFKAQGISLPKLRQLNFSDSFTNETFFFDDDYEELKLGQLVTTLFNATCKDTVTGEEISCVDSPTIRTPQHDACNGGTDPITGTAQTDETNTYQENYFPVVPGNTALEKIQRLRLEVDYPRNEIRLYASEYAEKILRAGKDINAYDPINDVITNPTRCEQQAVLDDLNDLVTEEERNAPGFEGVRLTAIEDPNYDPKYELDENGDIALDDEGNPIVAIPPTPIFTFEGTAIPERQ